MNAVDAMKTMNASGQRVAIVGVTGRMGREIRVLAAEAGFWVTAGVSGSANDTVEGVEVVERVDQLDASKIDVVIDFSLPEITNDVIAWCVRARKPLVSGVTGLTEPQKTALTVAGREIALLWAPNMSLGVAVMARMLAELCHLDGFDFQVEALHHARKKDKPSGTAFFLQERLKAAVQVPVPQPLAIRGGGIFGIHRIWAMGEEETITIEHTAMNRRVFARGALRAAQWILKKGPGLYRMDDVLGT